MAENTVSLQKLIDKFLLSGGEDTKPGVPEWGQEVMCDILMNNDELMFEAVDKLMEFKEIGHKACDVYRNGEPEKDITTVRVDFYVHWELLGGIVSYAIKQRKHDDKYISAIEERVKNYVPKYS